MRWMCGPWLVWAVTSAVAVALCCLQAAAVDGLPLPHAVDPASIGLSGAVRTEYGSVEGYEAFGVNHYLGIPFAAPPVGPLRFAPPVAPSAWSGTRPAFLPGSLCPQVIEGGLWLGEEDCLYLNVYAPGNATASSRLPVLVWLFGGAFVFGDGWEFGLYSATNLVRSHGYVVVTFNYRLAALGFLALDSLRPSSRLNSSGNAGIWDQVAALRWVRDNIAAFGGDPGRVTLAGESAGAMSVCIHLASRHSRGLFSAALMESGTCDSATFFAANNASVQWSTAFANSLGCHGPDSVALLACMQKVPLDKLVLPPNINDTQQAATASAAHAALSPLELHTLPNTLTTVQRLYSHAIPLRPLAPSNGSTPPVPLPLLYPAISWSPVIDGSLLVDTPLHAIRAGDWAQVPLVIGTNRDEGSIFISQLYSVLPGELHDPLVASDLPVILRHVFGNDSSAVAAVLRHYPLSAYPSVTNLTEALLRDYIFACPSRRVAAAIDAGSSGAGVWLYEFAFLSDDEPDPALGVYHSSELEYVFDNAWPPLLRSFTPRDRDMAAAIGAYWANLVHHGDVNEGEHTPIPWQRWTARQRASVRLDVPVQPDKDIYATVCDFWDALTTNHSLLPADTPLQARDDRRSRSGESSVAAE